MGLERIKLKLSPRYYSLLALLAAAIIIPSVVKLPPFLMRVLIKTLYIAFIAEAWNILAGYVGYFSLGHAAFFGLGAYTSSLLFDLYNVSPWLGMFAGAAVAATVSIAIGYPSIRLRGHYFVLVTIAFAEVLRIIFLQWDLVGGAVGMWIGLIYRKWFGVMSFMPYWFQFWPHLEVYYYVVLAFLLVEIFIMHRIERSRLGYYFIAIREDEDAAWVLGINITKYKLIATAISAALTSVGGVFYSHYVLFIDPPTTLSIDISINMCLVAIIGGMGTITGPIIGSFILTPISDYIRAWFGGGLMGLHLAIYGVLLMVVVILIPAGIIGPITKAYSLFLRSIGFRRRLRR